MLSSHKEKWSYSIVPTIFMPFGFLGPLKRLLNYVAFQSLNYERTWWNLLQKHIVSTELDIHVLLHKQVISSLIPWNTPNIYFILTDIKRMFQICAHNTD
jgi:hypothetical protein